MWTLVVLLIGTLPPTGIVQFGFNSEAECLLEASNYCDGSRKFRCDCTNKLTQKDMFE